VLLRNGVHGCKNVPFVQESGKIRKFLPHSAYSENTIDQIDKVGYVPYVKTPTVSYVVKKDSLW